LPKTKKKDDVEQIVAKAFAHPLRVQILIILNERVASPNLLSQELDQSLNLVAYHVRVLEKYDCIELVDTKQRRGATEHFYRATRRQFLSDAEWARMPQREQDGTATWSLSLLQRALRQADDGLPQVSTYTIWRTLHAAGLSWQKSRTWCETGIAMRKRKHGVVRVSDPDAAVKRG
jgi:hypothetical protein